MNSQFANRDGPIVHGKSAQFLIEKIIREQIFESLFWKEHCFSLDLYGLLETIVSKCTYIGGIYGTTKPVPFLCLLLKLLQLQPDVEIVLEMLQYPEFKYLRCIALFYLRLTQDAPSVYRLLEPFLSDFSRLRVQREDGSFALMHMDELVDDLLTQERVCGIILPRLTKRTVLEDSFALEPKVSIIEFELQELLYSAAEADTVTQVEEEEPAHVVKQPSGKLSFKKQSTRKEAQEEDPALAVIAAKRAEKDEVNASLSLEATNELRLKLGLKPLKR